jgi:hypothetical protein
MAQQNVGRDMAISFTVGGQAIAEFGLYTDTHFKPMWTETRSKPTNRGGIPQARTNYGGYEVDLNLDRVDGVPDQIIQFLEDNYIAGNPDVNVTIQVTVRNADGTVDQIMYLDGIMYPTDGGSFKGTENVQMTFKFFFQRRQLISSAATPTLSGAALQFVP